MKLLVFAINYYPEKVGIGKYNTDMCEWLASKGLRVDVITAMPYYPNWTIDDGYKNKMWFKEKINDVNVYRCPLYVPKKVTGLKRILHEISFLLSALIFWIPSFFRKYDYIICIYPPLIAGLFPVIHKILNKTRIILHIQDLQVDAAKELNIIKSKSLISLLFRIEEILLKTADIVSTISSGMMEKIIKKGVPTVKLKLFPNWVDTELMSPNNQLSQDRRKFLGFRNDDKIILYSGNIGEKQGLDTLLKVAKKYEEKNREDIKFLIVGNGVFKEKLILIKKKFALRNVYFYDLVPLNELPSQLNMADLHIILQKKGATDLVMPSKLTGILSCGGVPLVSSEKDSYLRKLIEENDIGFTSEPEDVDSLFESLNIALENKEILKAKSINARNFALETLKKSTILSDFYNKTLRLTN